MIKYLIDRLIDITQTNKKFNWKVPQGGYVKVNFDGAVDVHRMRGGIGVVARDERGQALGAIVAQVQDVSNPTMIESYVATRAPDFSADRGFQ